MTGGTWDLPHAHGRFESNTNRLAAMCATLRQWRHPARLAATVLEAQQRDRTWHGARTAVWGSHVLLYVWGLWDGTYDRGRGDMVATAVLAAFSLDDWTSHSRFWLTVLHTGTAQYSGSRVGITIQLDSRTSIYIYRT